MWRLLVLLVHSLHCPSPPSPPQIAEPSAGAGAAGSSSAYHLAKFAADAGLPVNITVFERNSYIGGRSTTVDAYEDPNLPVELGASIFVAVNSILNDAVKEFNLSLTAFDAPTAEIPGAALAVWDGQKVVHEQQYADLDGWWDIAKLLWKYGLAPIKTVRLMKQTVAKFIEMYDDPIFPFESLTQAVWDVGLLGATSQTGENYMAENGITGAFAHDIVQASTRVNYAQNLRHIHGLEAMVCMAAEGAMAVKGGNWQIFDNMVRASKANVLLEKTVTSMKRKEAGYQVTYGKESGKSLSFEYDHFDSVILAAPYTFADLIFHNQPEHGLPDQIPYVQLHVTLFASPYLISPAFVSYPPDKPAPKVILTTLPADEVPKEGKDGCGSPGFFSISLLRPVTNPHTGRGEYLYKIFSSSVPDSRFLSRLLGLEYEGGDLSEKDVSWIYRKIWHSYPYEYPRITFEPLQLEKNLWYTGAMEPFISTMETNALMGKNVARLIVDQLLKKRNYTGVMKTSLRGLNLASPTFLEG